MAAAFVVGAGGAAGWQVPGPATRLGGIRLCVGERWGTALGAVQHHPPPECLFCRLWACQGRGTAVCGVVNTQRSWQVDRNRSLGGENDLLGQGHQNRWPKPSAPPEGLFFRPFGRFFPPFRPVFRAFWLFWTSCSTLLYSLFQISSSSRGRRFLGTSRFFSGNSSTYSPQKLVRRARWAATRNGDKNRKRAASVDN